MNFACSAWRLAKGTMAAGLLAATALAAGMASAQAQADSALSGTLAKVRSAGAVTVGYRESSVPFSYLNSRKEPIGYSIELCRQLVDAMGDAVHKTLAIRWVPVTSASRIDAVANGQVDMECGSTTNNLERQKRVAFSPTMFVSGTKLLVKKGSPVKGYRDLAGKTVAVTSGTTNEKTMKDLSERFKLNLNIVVSADHAESFSLVKAGKADAFATDDVLLYGFIAEDKAASRGQSDYEVVGDFLSYDPYGVMFRKDDPQMSKLINESFQMLAQEGEIERQYKRWFLRKLPSGTSLDLPMSPQLETILQTMSVKSE
ncbi:amino acid ABC transporter substrate-binding protein [Variovorax sp. dw_308]|uniref:amino acid ABC transporter substrate-binding protein n=1 Tax=Variovorax sp. dw_308 TaxID=2721546 RepID=UPI00210E525B|nr:amino acid ABC transporter substrate-binding protein [Variovorax sp. dw_308]